MKIKTNAEGNILAWGTEVPGEEYSGVVPKDFDQTAGTGKYKFTNGEIVEQAGWVAPEPVSDFTPAPIS